MTPTRIMMTALGTLAVLVYAAYGAFLMNEGEVVAASERPLQETIAAMEAAGQPYTPVPGIIFAALGAGLAIGWAVLTLAPRVRLSGWFSLSILGAILACGAVAYFFTSFANMNSVGDTFADWNADAAFALAVPLYLASGIAALASIVALTVGVVQAVRRRPSSGSVPMPVRAVGA